MPARTIARADKTARGHPIAGTGDSGASAMRAPWFASLAPPGRAEQPHRVVTSVDHVTVNDVCMPIL